MKLNFIIQATVESRTGLSARVQVEVVDLNRTGEEAVLFSQTHHLTTDNFSTHAEPVLRNALTAVTNQLIHPLNEEINRNANAR